MHTSVTTDAISKLTDYIHLKYSNQNSNKLLKGVITNWIKYNGGGKTLQYRIVLNIACGTVYQST